jgi:hypothetical protein
MLDRLLQLFFRCTSSLVVKIHVPPLASFLGEARVAYLFPYSWHHPPRRILWSDDNYDCPIIRHNYSVDLRLGQLTK